MDGPWSQAGTTRFATTHNTSSASLDLMDGTNLEQPRGTLFDRNVVRAHDDAQPRIATTPCNTPRVIA